MDNFIPAPPRGATSDHLRQIMSYYRNITLNSSGIGGEVYRHIQNREIDKALELMQSRDEEVDEAIKEFNPQTHAVMSRPNKSRDKGEAYVTEKLPRTRQRYINDVELFFLFGRPVQWKKEDGEDEAFTLFMDFVKDQYFNSRIRQAKRLAGAETESALMFHIFRDDDSGERRVKSLVLARSTGYRLRPLIDQYGRMVAFAYGYVTRENGRNVQHWDFQTPRILAYCRRNSNGREWDVEIYPNPTGKINIIYFQQPKAWDGAESRISREEMLDSKTADTNNYFADPIAAASADVVESMVDPSKPGKLIQLSGQSSRFEYINPPQSSQTRESEKADLHNSILFDTYTPDFDVEKMRGLGTLSGVAIRNAMILGYIKRDNRKEIYGELIDRFIGVAIGILKYFHPDKAPMLDALKIGFEFSEPFAEDAREQWVSIIQLYNARLLSAETALTMLALTDSPKEEMERIRNEAEQQRMQQQSGQTATPQEISEGRNQGKDSVTNDSDIKQEIL